MKRRDFIKVCAATAASAPAFSVQGAAPRRYAPSRLVADDGRPLRAADIPVERNLIFHYPYASTPCFLLNLGRPLTGARQLHTARKEAYAWDGGVGPRRSIVAYSAICAHRLTYPTREISFISYRVETSARNRHGHVIHCCSEHSQYDPAQGARVVAGPAPQPLAAILLEYDAAADTLTAVGTLGGELFNDFFDKYRFRLAMEHGGRERRQVGATSRVIELASYCRQQVKC